MEVKEINLTSLAQRLAEMTDIEQLNKYQAVYEMAAAINQMQDEISEMREKLNGIISEIKPGVL